MPMARFRVPQAVLFDLDGVVTDTTRAHAAAWKRSFDEFLGEHARRGGGAFRPFDARDDYLRHVDGKPRSAGVRDFLASRGIHLPEGGPDDGPDRETVHGLGNRKNAYFRHWLASNPVRTWPGTLRLVRELRAAGVRTVVFSASRNAEAVLRSAGALELFDARLDGNELDEAGIPGKPDPATLLLAAARVGAAPERTAVVEDAVAGVEAGARGGFGLVIGVDRGGHEDDLKSAGANLVVGDLSELGFGPDEGFTVKTLGNLPSVWDCEATIHTHLGGKTPAVFLDYDGTLTPIVADHAKALLAAEMRETVEALAAQCPVIIVSGRDLERLQALVDLPGVLYAGSHGFDIAGAHGSDIRLQQGTGFLTELDEVEGELRAALAAIPGHAVERKRFSIAVHYRQVAADSVDTVRVAVDRVLDAHPRLRLGHGKKVFEIRPDIDWGKGEAVRWILERLALDHPGVVPVYVGDDITDEDAFRMLAGHGLCIAVRHDEARRTAADYALADIGEVRRFLEMLQQCTAENAATGASAP